MEKIARMRLWLTLWAASMAVAADLNRGIELYEQENFAEAKAELSQVVAENPDDARARRYLGLALVEQGNVSEGAPHIDKAHELEPSGETRLARARLYVAQKEYDRAEAQLEQASGEELGYVRGLLRFHQQRHEEAAQELENFLEGKPEKAYAHYYAGLAYNALRRQDKMLTHFELFLKLKPKAPEARKVRSVLKTGR
jgi:tetratricopeptide (TPR) repeat protein